LCLKGNTFIFFFSYSSSIDSSLPNLKYLDIGIPEFFDGIDIKNLKPQGLDYNISSTHVCLTIPQLEGNQTGLFLIGLVEGSFSFLLFIVS